MQTPDTYNMYVILHCDLIHKQKNFNAFALADLIMPKW